MTNKQKESSADGLLISKNTDDVILLLEVNRKLILREWVEAVRLEFNEPESTTDRQLADHMLYILDALIAEFRRFATDSAQSKSYKQGDFRYVDREIEDEKKGGEVHGRQRAGINAYNADKVFWEYVILRKIIIRFVQKHRQLDIDHLEIITCVIESCSRDSLITFSKTVQNIQRNLLGTLVHDIRSPLSSISMMGDYISILRNTDKSWEFAKKIVSISGRISVMLEDMLSTLSVEAGQGLELRFGNHNLNKILSEVKTEFQVIHGARLKLNLPNESITSVFDDRMIMRVIENLISNAFKYGETKSNITLTAAETESSIVLDVHNFGEPIDKEFHDDIFKYLKRFEGQEGGSDRSWGIGLAFVKAVVEGHGGIVTLSSDAIQGTRFLIDIPKKSFKQGDTITVPI
tara:strand:+ start:1636 stop:2850 length:1215 start_codon:yes stop_codon:yes gene_type:complete